MLPQKLNAFVFLHSLDEICVSVGAYRVASTPRMRLCFLQCPCIKLGSVQAGHEFQWLQVTHEQTGEMWEV
jgi:hypothetical protein